MAVHQVTMAMYETLAEDVSRLKIRANKLENRADDAKAMLYGRCEDRTKFDRLKQRVGNLELVNTRRGTPQYERSSGVFGLKNVPTCAGCEREMKWEGNDWYCAYCGGIPREKLPCCPTFREAFEGAVFRVSKGFETKWFINGTAYRLMRCPFCGNEL